MNHGTSPMAQWIKNLPAMQETQETWVQSLGQEGLLKEEMATHSSMLFWKVPWIDGLGRLLVHKDSDMTEQLSMNTQLQNKTKQNKQQKNLCLIIK